MTEGPINVKNSNVNSNEAESTPLVLTTKEGRTLHLTLNNPKALNSLSLAMISAIFFTRFRTGKWKKIQVIEDNT